MSQTIKLKRGTSTPTTSNIVSGEVAIDTSAKKLYVNDAGTIKEIGGPGTLSASDIPNLPASKITSGTLSTARIPNLNASKITAGTIALARLPTIPYSQLSGTPTIPTLNDTLDSVTDRGATTTNAISTGAITATANTDALTVQTSANAEGATIRFADNGTNGSGSQKGYITHRHSDSQSYGSGASFALHTTEPTLTVLADGKLMFKEGLYVKPASGTGAGTQIITSARVLQNVTANANIITSGTFATARIPSLPASKITSGTLDVARLPTIPYSQLSGTPTIPTSLPANGGNADTVDGVHAHGAVRNNHANKLVRTDGNGYIQAGWINTTSGNNGTTAISRIYASQDGYIRYYTPANFGAQISSHINYDSIQNKPTIPSTANLVTTNTAQTITGVKTFAADVNVSGNRSANFYAFNGAYLKATTDARAPIFYDHDDTAYYANPAGMSELKELRTGKNHHTNAPRYDTSFYVAQSQHWYGHNSSQTMYIGESANPVRLRGTLNIGSNADVNTSMRLTVRGHADATDSLRAPIFYDLNNTGYYLNPNGTSNLNIVDAVRITQGFQLGDNNGGRLYFGNNATRSYFAPRNSGDTDWNWSREFGFDVTNDRWYVDSQIYAGSVRSPIYYDHDNTGYYLNPASDSRVSRLLVGDGSNYIRIGDEGEGANTSYARMRTNSSGDLYLDAKDGRNIYLSWWTGTSARIFSEAGAQFPIYYDRNNTARYVDPASTSSMHHINMNNGNLSGVNHITINDPGPTEGISWAGGNGWKIVESPDNLTTNSGGNFQFVQSSTRRMTLDTSGNLDLPSGNLLVASDKGITTTGAWTRFTTAHGYIQLGPANTSHAHIYTNLSNFYMNKTLNIKGGTQLNQNDVRSPIFYDKDNTNWFINPASTGTSGKFAGNVEIHGDLKMNGTDSLIWTPNADNRYTGFYDSRNSVVALKVNTNTPGNESVTFGGNGGNTSSVWINTDNQNNYNGYNENIRLFNAGNGVSVIAFGASAGTNSGTPTTSILGYGDRFETRVGSTWRQRIYGGYIEVNGSIRPDLMYDRNDTNYYVDPASTTKLKELHTVATSANPFRWQRSSYAQTGQDDNVSVFVDDSNIYFRHNNDADGDASGFHFQYSNNNTATTMTTINADYLSHFSDVRAPVFYDSIDTNYHVDPASESVLNAVRAHHFRLSSGDGKGLRFWNSDSYKVYMSSTGNSSWGGRAPYESTSDYNMYFRMKGGTNRGFVFRNDTTNVAGIDSSGNFNTSGIIKTGNGAASAPAYSFTADYDSGMFSIGSNAVGFATGGTQRFKINSNGLLLTGGSSLWVNGQQTITNTRDIANVVNYQNTDGHMQLHRTGAAPLIINRKGTTGSSGSSRGEICNFKSANTKIGRIGYAQPYGGNFYFAANDWALGLYSFSSSRFVQPSDHTGGIRDNQIDLGSTTARFDDVYATNGTIQTSDRNEKQDIQELTDAETRAAVTCKGLMRRFRWVDSVAEKGDDARYHFGAIAQDVEAAFIAEGLDAGDYGLFIRTTWWEHENNWYPEADVAPEGAVEKTRLGIRYNQLFAFIIGAL